MGRIELKGWKEVLESDTLTIHFTGTAEITKKQSGFHLSGDETHPAKLLSTPNEMNAELTLRGISLNEWW